MAKQGLVRCQDQFCPWSSNSAKKRSDTTRSDKRGTKVDVSLRLSLSLSLSPSLSLSVSSCASLSKMLWPSKTPHLRCDASVCLMIGLHDRTRHAHRRRGPRDCVARDDPRLTSKLQDTVVPRLRELGGPRCHTARLRPQVRPRAQVDSVDVEVESESESDVT